eukprot:scaffold11902_cov21-Tisochrysis_lutea.AAC.3
MLPAVSLLHTGLTVSIHGFQSLRTLFDFSSVPWAQYPHGKWLGIPSEGHWPLHNSVYTLLRRSARRVCYSALKGKEGEYGDNRELSTQSCQMCPKACSSDIEDTVAKGMGSLLMQSQKCSVAAVHVIANTGCVLQQRTAPAAQAQARAVVVLPNKALLLNKGQSMVCVSQNQGGGKNACGRRPLSPDHYFAQGALVGSSLGTQALYEARGQQHCETGPHNPCAQPGNGPFLAFLILAKHKESFTIKNSSAFPFLAPVTGVKLQLFTVAQMSQSTLQGHR